MRKGETAKNPLGPEYAIVASSHSHQSLASIEKLKNRDQSRKHENMKSRNKIQRKSPLFVFSIFRAFVMKFFLGSRLKRANSSLLGGIT